MNRAELSSGDFSYELTDDQIAKYPLADRNQSKLLTYKSGQISEDVFANLHDHLPKGSVLVFNDTKVLSARLRFQKATGARIEVFCLEPYDSTAEQALAATHKCSWQAMVGNLKRFKANDVLVLEIAGTKLRCRLNKRLEKEVIVDFEWEGGIPFSDILEKAGEVPLPPYLNREAEAEDRETYQTVYARREGAVAAPTAGLHFVPEQLEALKKAAHQLAYLTLYVGAGTFRQVKAERLVDHDMHSERIVVKRSTIEQLMEADGNIIPVGTTSLRSLESLYWLASKIRNLKSEIRNDKHDLRINQDDAYRLNDELSRREALEFLIEYLNEQNQQQLDFHSALFIMPAYRWKMIDGLVTNFHQPQSTLLALVASWIGDDWQHVYQYALENHFRFLSYGDSSLLLR